MTMTLKGTEYVDMTVEALVFTTRQSALPLPPPCEI